MRSVLVLALLVRTAGAEPRRVVVDTPIEAFKNPGAIATYLYLNRCVGGCLVTGSTMNDASMGISNIPTAGPHTVTAFANGDDSDWNAIVQCMKEVYSPYGITVTDQPPPAGTLFNEAIIAGNPQDIGLGNDILGISPMANDCSPIANVISFSFANHHGTRDRVQNICWTAAQESAHAYGLDHEYEFSDKTSSCSDPMTYRVDCGGQKFFRNKRATCGEMAARPCKCSATQNSHERLLASFGEGTPITPPPTASILFPAADAIVAPGWVTQVTAGSQRGVAKVELFLNGSRWMVQPGAKFGAAGQANPSSYPFFLPMNVPDGTIDIQAIAHDDIGMATASPVVTVTKGVPCTSDATCLVDQKCDEGRCRWDAPTGELGDSCTYDQSCKTWTCLGNDDKFCTQPCFTDEPTSCPSGFECVGVQGEPVAGYCFIPGGGCCSIGHDRGAIWAHGALALVVIGSLRRRRSR